MLVLSRKIGEQIRVPQVEFTLTVLEIRGGQVRLGVSAPTGLEVHRQEVWDRIVQGFMGVKVDAADRKLPIVPPTSDF